MHLTIVTGIFLSVSMVFGGDNTAKHHYNMDVKGLKIEEDVEVHQSERYLKIEIPATRNKSAVTIIHHFGQNLTQYRQAGQCFLLSNFHAFAMGMDDWMQEDYEVPVITDEEVERLYNFKAAPFHIDIKSLPLVMQDGCKVIYPAVLHNTVQGKAAFEEEETTDSPYVVEVFGPPTNGQLEKPGRPKRFIFTLIFAIITITAVSGIAGAAVAAGVIASQLPKPAPNSG